MRKKIGVLVCDDSALMRRSLTKIIEMDSELAVVGTARDGEDAIIKARELRPDVVTMDINMPGMDGLTALQLIVHERLAPVLMVSSLTSEGAEATFEAMALGAFDYVPKPGGTVSSQMNLVTQELVSKIKSAAQRGTMNKLARSSKARVAHRSPIPVRQIGLATKAETASTRAVALGISTGGPKTLLEILPLLPNQLDAPIFIVQHMPPSFTSSFAKRIDTYSPLRCFEAEAGMNVEPGTIYLARGGYHMTFFKKPSGSVSIRTPTKPPHQFMPSVDVMMHSVLDVYGSATIGVLMTGMGADGAEAMIRIRQSGGITIAESEETAIVYGMPREAVERGGAQIVVPSWDIISEIVKAIK